MVNLQAGVVSLCEHAQRGRLIQASTVCSKQQRKWYKAAVTSCDRRDISSVSVCSFTSMEDGHDPAGTPAEPGSVPLTRGSGRKWKEQLQQHRIGLHDLTPVSGIA